MHSYSDCLAQAKKVTKAKSHATMMMLVKEWNLGPEMASEDRGANKAYWSHLATVWKVTEKVARRRLCGNCEYGKGSPEFLEAMEHIPNGKPDKDGGGRVWCKKFSFICHNLRTCQAYSED